MAKQKRTPFDVKLGADQKEELALWLSRELDNALTVRTATENEVAYYHTLYEQGRTRGGTNSPWPDAADLTSPIGTEKVDALRSRIVRTIFSEQVFTVEGWGEAAGRAPLVEEFHNWQIETIGFQGVFARAVHLSLIEPRGVIEIYEDQVRRPIRRKIRAALALDPMTGQPSLGPDMLPVLETGPDGRAVEVPEQDPQTGQPTPSVEMVVDDFELVCQGPRARVVAYRDFLQLPGHAREQSEVWGYAKRFSRRLDELEERVKQGQYDAEAVEEIGTDDERPSLSTLAGEARAVAAKDDQLAEKELWEVTFLANLDKKGLRWYVATVHKDKQQLLRVQYDDINKPRYFSLVPFPRPDSLEGYSFIGNKLITVIEENTAWRNMLTDRGSLQLRVPMKRMQGALWNPDNEPIGANTVITVRHMQEVMPLEIPDYTAPARERILDTERQAEKLAGMSDIASGSQPTEDRTLGETQLIAVNSEVRIDEVVRNIQEPLEDIGQVLHLLWTRRLAEMPQGLMAPPSLLRGLETRGPDVTKAIPDQRFTAAMFEGQFRFKPKNSVESADKPRQQRLFAQGMQALGQLMQMSPFLAMIAQQPSFAKAVLERWVYLFGGGMDKGAFLGPQVMAMLAEQMQVPGMMPGMPMMPGGPMPPVPPGLTGPEPQEGAPPA